MKATHSRSARAVAVLVSLAAASLSLAFATPAVAAGKAPAASASQKAQAIAKPSIVFIQTKWHGWLMNGPLAELLSPGNNNAPSFTVTTMCTGFVANPQGYIVTAGHCVDNQSMQYGGKGLIIQAAVAAAVGDGYIGQSQAAAVIQQGYQNWRVEGTESGSPPDRTVGVFPTVAASGIKTTTPMVATVTSVVPFLQGDVALLKVSTQTPMPAVQVATGSPQDGQPVVAMGYPGSVSQSVDFNISEPSATTGEISGQQTVGGVPFTEITAATSAGMSGGPVINMAGRVVGTVSWQPGAETQSFNFITDTSAIRSLLATAAVSNSLSRADQLYRTGLTDYFAGHYHAAARAFSQVLALEPNHAMAQEYQRLSITNYPNEVVAPKKASSNSTLLYVLIGVGVVVLLLAGGGTAMVMRRRRGTGGPGPGVAAPVSMTGVTSVPAQPTAAAPAAPAPAPAPAQPTVAAPAPAAPAAQAPAESPPVGVVPAPVESPQAPPVETAAAPVEAAPAPAGVVAQPAPPAGTAAEQPATTSPGGFCPQCGQAHAANAQFCSACGLQLREIAGRYSTNGVRS